MRPPPLDTLHSPLNPALERFLQRNNIQINSNTTEDISKVLGPSSPNMVNEVHVHEHRHNLDHQRGKYVSLGLKIGLSGIEKGKTVN